MMAMPHAARTSVHEEAHRGPRCLRSPSPTAILRSRLTWPPPWPRRAGSTRPHCARATPAAPPPPTPPRSLPAATAAVAAVEALFAPPSTPLPPPLPPLPPPLRGWAPR